MSALIGPTNAPAWVAQFARASQFAIGVFATGPGTAYPLPSMPLAQATRYWWAVKHWRIQINQTCAGTNGVIDSGLRPWGCGYDGTGLNPSRNRRFWPDSGDRLGVPTTQDRYVSALPFYRYIGPYPFMDQGAITYEGNDDASNPFGGGIFLFGPGVPPNAGAGAVLPAIGGCVWDDAIPGNVFLSFVIWGAGPGPNLFFCSNQANNAGAYYYNNNGDLAEATGQTVTLDGMSIPTYQDSGSAIAGNTITGTIAISTYNS